MKGLHYKTLNNLSLLHDELLAAMPALRPVPNTEGRLDLTGAIAQDPVITVEGTTGNVWLMVPDDADEAAIATVVQAHDSAKTQPDPRGERLARIAEICAIPRSTWTPAQMRELIELMAQEVGR